MLCISDTEREQVAARVRDAAAVGMLTLAELTEGLPAAQTQGPAELDWSMPPQPRSGVGSPGTRQSRWCTIAGSATAEYRSRPADE